MGGRGDKTIVQVKSVAEGLKDLSGKNRTSAQCPEWWEDRVCI